MIELAQDANLSNSLLLTLSFLQLTSIVLLDGDLITRGLVDTLFDDSISAVAYLLAKVVRVELVAVGGLELPRARQQALRAHVAERTTMGPITC